MSKSLWWFVPLLFLMTVDFRIELGFLSIAIAEPFVLLAAAAVLLPKILRREPLQWRHPLLLIFAAMAAWALIIRPFAPDWKHGLSDIRDWVLPALLLFTYLNVSPNPARSWLTGFVVVLLVNSGMAVLQHLTDNDALRPFIHEGTVFKGGLDGSGEAPFGVAFFDAPNGLGMYLATGIPLLIGWLRENGRQRFGLLRYALLLLPLYALYASFARTSLLVFALLGAFLLLEFLIRSTPGFRRMATILLGASAVAAVLALNVLPHVLLRTLWWRVALWEIAGITLRDYPFVWIAGNGIDRFIPISFYPQPHNLYVFMLLEYGLVGVLLTLALIVWLLNSGLNARAQGFFEAAPSLAPLWVGVLGFFLVGMTETIWLAINNRMLFVTVVALYSLRLAQVAPALVTLPRWRLRLPAQRSAGLSRTRHL